MEKRKLNYRFHDPNPASVTAGYILKIFVEANARKVEKAMREAAGILSASNKNQGEGHSA